MLVDEFLRTVVTSKEGYFCLATRQESGWSESFYRWPDALDEILGTAAVLRETGDVYFSSHLFSDKRSLKSLVLPSRTLQADLDHADIGTLPVVPSIVTQTSPTRHQGFWILDQELEAAALEEKSRRIAYAIPDCDKTGWPAGKKVRLPNTYNYKYASRKLVDIVGISLRKLHLDIINNFPAVQVSVEKAVEDIEWVETDPGELDVELIQMLAEVKPQIPARVFSQYTKPAKDRSAVLWAFETECFKAGLTREQVYWLAKYHANNKFAERPNGDIDLRRDILKAEQHVSTQAMDPVGLIMQIRMRDGISAVQKYQMVAQTVINYMRENGEFVHTFSGKCAYLRRDTGKPIHISGRSNWLEAYLGSTFGLNFTETYTRYVMHELITYCRSQTPIEDMQNLAYYDTFSNRLLLHTGGRDVLHVSADSIETHANGYGNIVFQWTDDNELITLDSPLHPDEPWRWAEHMFGVGALDSVTNVTNLDRDEAIVVLRSLLLTVLFRKATTSRPIFALLGPPGSGKTTIAKKFYRLVYGRSKSISKVRDEDGFDLSMSAHSLLAFDNIDSWIDWLPNALAVSTMDTVVEKRQLYTDTDTIRIKRQAVLLLSAHNPRFTREDVIDRMVAIMFSRLPSFDDDSIMMEAVSEMRGALWADIIRDVQRILATRRPASSEAPQFRIKDFSTLGLWFARAAAPEHEKLFVSSMAKLAGSQSDLALDENQAIVEALKRYIDRPESSNFHSATELYNLLVAYAPNANAFQRIVKNAMLLSRKLVIIQDSLRSLFNIEWEYEDNRVSKRWRITRRT